VRRVFCKLIFFALIIGALAAAGEENANGTFPRIRDWDSVRIQLIRTACYGTCPDYTVTIYGNGNVEFDGHAFVGSPGEHRARIPREKVKELVAEFEKAGYFYLQDRYSAPVTDAPTYVTCIAFDDRKKCVIDYEGTLAGMPKSVRDLGNAIDRVADTARWIGSRQAPSRQAPSSR